MLVIPICLSTLLTGCGNSEEAANTSNFPAPLHACEILKNSELEEILGAQANKPEETFKEHDSSKHWMSMCIYYSDEKQIGMGITILPHGRSVTGEQAFLQHQAELKKSLGNDYKQEVIDGIGDYAGWDGSTKQLTVFQGQYMLIIGVNSPRIGEAEALEISKKVSRQLISKLTN